MRFLLETVSLLWLVTVAITPEIYGGVTPPADVNGLVSRLEENPTEIDPAAIPPSLRDQAAELLSRDLANASGHQARVRVEAALVRLGDDHAISGLLCEFSTSRSPDERSRLPEVFRRAAAPGTISYLAPYVFLDDRLAHVQTDSDAVERKSIVSARLVGYILANSAAFPPRTRAWAQQLCSLTGREIRDGVRSWWLTNGRAFSESRFRELKSP